VGLMFRSLTPQQLTVDIVVAAVCLLLRFAIGIDGLALTAVVMIMAAALAIRRLSPGLALAVAWGGALLQMASGSPPDASNIAILAVLFATARYGPPKVRWLGLASAGAGAIIATAYYIVTGYLRFYIDGFYVAQRLPQFSSESVAQITFIAVVGLASASAVLGLSWTLGLLANTRDKARESRRRQRAAEQTVVIEQERNRIARDMHDVVAHSLAVVIAQSDGGRYSPDAEAKDEALTTISATAREALADVRLLLGQLRHSQDAGPQPMLADLDRLVDQLRASGLTIRFEQRGEPLAMPAGQQLAIYRIVQEALTNALRHGDTSQPVDVLIVWSTDAVTLSITNAATAAPGPQGHGLAGMRERAILVGGTFGAAPDGPSFVVDARIPVSA